MNMKMRARQRWRKHRCPHCKLRQSKRSGSPCPNEIIKVCICCDFCRRDCALDAATAFLRQERNEPRELNASPALGAPLYAPTLVTKPTEMTRSAEPLPARLAADYHARDSKPPGGPNRTANIPHSRPSALGHSRPDLISNQWVEARS